MRTQWYKINSRYYLVDLFLGKIIRDSIFEPNGDEEIKVVTYEEFDKILNQD